MPWAPQLPTRSESGCALRWRVVLPLGAGVAAGRPALGAAASFGTLAVLYVPRSPYRYRARVVGRIGVGLVLAVLVGSLAAAHGAVSALVAGLAAEGALVAWLLTMAPALAGRWRAPEQAAVAGALEAGDAVAPRACRT